MQRTFDLWEHLPAEIAAWAVRIWRALLRICRALLRICRAFLRICSRLWIYENINLQNLKHKRCAYVGLFCRYVGLFCRYTGLFCGYAGLFGGHVGLFCRFVGLFGGYAGLVCGYIGLFCGYVGLCEYVGLFCGYAADFWLMRISTCRIWFENGNGCRISVPAKCTKQVTIELKQVTIKQQVSWL